MGTKGNEYKIDGDTVNKGQIPGITDNLMSMLKGPDTNDSALFAQRLMKAKGHQIDNQMSSSTRDARNLMAEDPAFVTQLAKSIGLGPEALADLQSDPGRMLNFGNYVTQSNSPQLNTQALGNVGSGVDSRVAAGQKLRNDDLAATILRQILRMKLSMIVL